ncbi:MAG: hypothetical protein FJX95_01710 [Bacteroidetes bacterium]|nr:hypothetical protein [Bacteroidota bacterium]
MWIFSALTIVSCGDKNNGEDPPTEDTTNVPDPDPTPNQAQLNFIWMSTPDANLQSMIGAVLEIYNQDGVLMSSNIDVRSLTDVVFDWNPGVVFDIGKIYHFKLKDPGGNVVDEADFVAADALNEDEFAIVTSHCVYFLQLSWQIA